MGEFDFSTNDDAAISAQLYAAASQGADQAASAQVQRTDYVSGALQSALAVGSSYLTRRIDIDLQGRVAGMQAKVALPSTQRVVSDHADLTTRGVASVGGMRLGDLLPWAVGLGLLFLFLPKKG